MITPTYKVRQQHTRQGTNTVIPASVFNDRGAYNFVTDASIICPELNYMGGYPATAFALASGTGPAGFQPVGVTADWNTNYKTCTYFNGTGQHYSWPLSAAWSSANTGEGLQLNFKIRLNSFPASNYNIFEWGNAQANRGYQLRIVYTSGTTASLSIYNGTGTSSMWLNAMSLNVWYTIGFWTTQGTVLYSCTADPSTNTTFTTRVNNAAKSWGNANLATDRMTIGGASSGVGSNTFDGWITDLVIYRVRNALDPSPGTGNWQATMFL